MCCWGAGGGLKAKQVHAHSLFLSMALPLSISNLTARPTDSLPRSSSYHYQHRDLEFGSQKTLPSRMFIKGNSRFGPLLRILDKKSVIYFLFSKF
jgi:hypothetical protein